MINWKNFEYSYSDQGTTSFQGLEIGAVQPSVLEQATYSNAGNPVWVRPREACDNTNALGGYSSVTRKIPGGTEYIGCYKGKITVVLQILKTEQGIIQNSYTPEGKLTGKLITERVDKSTSRTTSLDGDYNVLNVAIRKRLDDKHVQVTVLSPGGKVISNTVRESGANILADLQLVAQDAAPLVGLAAGILMFIPGAQGAAAILAAGALGLKAMSTGKIDASTIKNMRASVKGEYGMEGQAGYDLALNVMSDKPITSKVTAGVPLAKMQISATVDAINAVKAKGDGKAADLSDYEIEKTLSDLPINFAMGVKAGIATGYAKSLSEKGDKPKKQKEISLPTNVKPSQFLAGRLRLARIQEKDNWIENLWNSFLEFLQKGI